MTLKLNMKDLNPGIFFLWPSDNLNDKDGITIRSLNNVKQKEFVEAATTVDTEYEGTKPIEKKEYDSNVFDALMYDYCIVKWTGIVDDKDKALPCSTKNKMKIINEHPAIATMVNMGIAICQSERALKDKNELKNLFRS